MVYDYFRVYYMDLEYVLECFRFRYVLENFGDFGAFLGAKLHRRIICLAVDVDLPTV